LKNQYFLLIISLIESIQILFKALTLPNRLSVNLFCGSLLGNIFILPIFDHSLTMLVYYCFILILIFELDNAGLHLFIFLLLSMN
jgi:F0F1-type ATP synthase membrane subunit a